MKLVGPCELQVPDLQTGYHTRAERISAAVKNQRTGDRLIAGKINWSVVETQPAVSQMNGDPAFRKIRIAETKIVLGIDIGSTPVTFHPDLRIELREPVAAFE